MIQSLCCGGVTGKGSKQRLGEILRKYRVESLPRTTKTVIVSYRVHEADL